MSIFKANSTPAVVFSIYVVGLCADGHELSSSVAARINLLLVYHKCAGMTPMGLLVSLWSLKCKRWSMSEVLIYLVRCLAMAMLAWWSIAADELSRVLVLVLLSHPQSQHVLDIPGDVVLHLECLDAWFNTSRCCIRSIYCSCSSWVRSANASASRCGDGDSSSRNCRRSSGGHTYHPSYAASPIGSSRTYPNHTTGQCGSPLAQVHHQATE